jgi:hypothetical protein
MGQAGQYAICAVLVLLSRHSRGLCAPHHVEEGRPRGALLRPVHGKMVGDEMIEEPLHWPEALTNLIDALRDFILADSLMGAELLKDNAITRQQYDDGMEDIRFMDALLKRLEELGPDPSLNGTVQSWTSQHRRD